ncbi:hypothetical protein [Nitrosarchaeum sp. AC2]|uniref:calcium-binding protein n=1 Tax=Nitrosarchaeum sp. AC2 TaxID=2259673 RepID=UPI0015CCFAD8|nr:hypothetical protein [Nitrosarchaeum sp. AC2]
MTRKMSNNKKTSTIVVMSIMAIIVTGVSVVPTMAQQNAIAVINCPTVPGTEQCHGTSGADTIVGSANRDIIIGYDGNDTITGNGGNDNIYGYNGADNIDGGADNDNLYHGSSSSGADGSADTLTGGSGTDSCRRNTSDGDSATCETLINW